MTDPLRQWPRFARAVRDRLDAGQRAYADRSFSRHPVELLHELQQEALDMAGWGFVLFTRLQAAVDALSGADPAQGAPEPQNAPEALPALDMVALELTLLIQPHEAAMLLRIAKEVEGIRGDERARMRATLRYCFHLVFQQVFGGAANDAEALRMTGAARAELDDGKRFCSVCRRSHGGEVVHPCE